MEAVFTLVIAALSVVLGGLFLGWLVMHVVGERPARILVSGVAALGVLAELKDFQASADSAGLLIGLAVLLVGLYRREVRARIVSLRHRGKGRPVR